MANIGNDCHFYYSSVCNKGEECPYRHCQVAKNSTLVCRYWKQGQCNIVDCPYRHSEMPQTLTGYKKSNRVDLPCFWDSKPGGCRKTNCQYKHGVTKAKKGGSNIITLVDASGDYQSPVVSQSSSVEPDTSQSPPRLGDAPLIQPVIVNIAEDSDIDSIHDSPVKSRGVSSGNLVHPTSQQMSVEKENAFLSTSNTSSVPDNEDPNDKQKLAALDKEHSDCHTGKTATMTEDILDTNLGLDKSNVEANDKILEENTLLDEKKTESKENKSENQKPKVISLKRIKNDSQSKEDEEKPKEKPKSDSEDDEDDIGIKSLEQTLREKALKAMGIIELKSGRVLRTGKKQSLSPERSASSDRNQRARRLSPNRRCRSRSPRGRSRSLSPRGRRSPRRHSRSPLRSRSPPRTTSRRLPPQKRIGLKKTSVPIERSRSPVKLESGTKKSILSRIGTAVPVKTRIIATKKAERKTKPQKVSSTIRSVERKSPKDRKSVAKKTKTNLKTSVANNEDLEDIDFSQEIDIELGEELPAEETSDKQEETGSSGSEEEEEEIEEIIEEIIEEEVTDDEQEEEVVEEEDTESKNDKESEDSDDEVVIKLVKKKSGKVLTVDSKTLKSLTSKGSKATLKPIVTLKEKGDLENFTIKKKQTDDQNSRMKSIARDKNEGMKRRVIIDGDDDNSEVLNKEKNVHVEKPTIKNRLGLKADLSEKLGFTCDIDEKLEKARRAMERAKQKALQESSSKEDNPDAKKSTKSLSIWNRRTWESDGSNAPDSEGSTKPVLKRIGFGSEKEESDDKGGRRRQGWRRNISSSTCSSPSQDMFLEGSDNSNDSSSVGSAVSKKTKKEQKIYVPPGKKGQIDVDEPPKTKHTIITKDKPVKESLKTFAQIMAEKREKLKREKEEMKHSHSRKRKGSPEPDTSSTVSYSLSDSRLEPSSSSDLSSLVSSASDSIVSSERKSMSISSRWRKKKDSNDKPKSSQRISPVNISSKNQTVSDNIEEKASLSPERTKLSQDKEEASELMSRVSSGSIGNVSSTQKDLEAYLLEGKDSGPSIPAKRSKHLNTSDSWLDLEVDDFDVSTTSQQDDDLLREIDELLS